MSKKKSEKEEKEKKHSAKKALLKAKPPVVAAAEPAAPEPKPKTKKAKAAPVKKAVKIAAISDDEIGLRAYYIAERRQKMGWPGDSTADWVEAERQLKAEAARKK